MREEFRVTGQFYIKDGFKFRKFLNIIKKNSDIKRPDLMVIMMNPGSSKPIDGNDNNIESEAIPDKTQDQIMKVMKNCDFDFARILNLSDLREPKSSVFYKKIEELEKLKIPHSIFDKNRKNDYETLFVKNIPVIFAWGVNEKLSELATLTIKRIGEVNPIGLKKNEYAYYHPLPQSFTKQKEWVEKITEKSKKST